MDHHESLKTVFAGTPEFAARALAALIESHHDVIAVYTQPDRPAGRGRKLRPSDVKALALEHGIDAYQPASLKPAEQQQALQALAPDIMVVAAYGLILPQAILDTPRLGCVNIHASLLPRWRGAAPIQRSILAGDNETGVTIMQMAAGLDTGAMLLKRSCPIEPDDTAQTLHDRLAELGAQAIVAALDGLQNGTLTAEPQDDTQACYAAKLTKSEALLDWTQPADMLARQVRAFNPWPVAHTRMGEEVLRIWRAVAVTPRHTAPPGTVITADKTGIVVAAGSGALSLQEVQLPGGRPLPVADVLNARAQLRQPGYALGGGAFPA